MARRALGDIMATPPDVDRERLVATTEAEIRRHAREDGHDPDGEVDGYRRTLSPRAVRKRLGLTQAAFASALRVPVGTVRNWEQARTLPDPAARSLLDAVAAAPDAVLGALRATGDQPARETSQQAAAVPSGDGVSDVDAPARAWLAQRRDARGHPLLDAIQLAASVRLQGDIRAAALLPGGSAKRLSIDVDASGVHGPDTTSDQVIAARRRVRDALAAVGEDLSGILIDLCGFLKDLGRIEMERRWPPRSAEVVVRIALRRLANHYGPESEPIGTIRSADLSPHARIDEAGHAARRA